HCTAPCCLWKNDGRILSGRQGCRLLESDSRRAKFHHPQVEHAGGCTRFGLRLAGADWFVSDILSCPALSGLQYRVLHCEIPSIMIAGYILALVFIGVLVGLHYRFTRDNLAQWYWPALGARILGGLAVGYFYIIYHGAGDPVVFSRDATFLAGVAREDPARCVQFLWSGTLLEGLANQQLRSVFMVKVLSVVYLLTSNSFWIASIFLSFFSFVAAWFLVRVIATRWQVSVPAIIAFLFWPSIVVWSSGVLKEAIATPCLFIMVACLLKIRDNPRQW